MQMGGLYGFNGCGYKCFRQPHTLWTWRSWQCPFSLHLFSCCQALAADHTPSLLCCSAMPSSLQPVINKKWGDASWMEESGTTPSWAKSALKLAFFVVTGSNSVTFTDGKAQSSAGSKGYWASKWELWSPNRPENNSQCQSLLHKCYFLFPQQSERQISPSPDENLKACGYQVVW